MNFFCRLFRHTWQYKVRESKIRWTAAKNMNEMDQSAADEPRPYLECARCGERIEDPSPDQVAQLVF